MNILFYLSTTFSPMHGGIANVSIWLGKFLQEEGYKIYYLSAQKTCETQSDNQYYLPDKNVLSKINQDYFLKMCQKWNIDIVINQMGATPTQREAIIWSCEASIPVITVVHGTLYGLYGINSKLHRFHKIIKACGLWSACDKILHYIFRYRYGKYYRFQAVKSNKIVLLSDLFKEQYFYYSNVKSNKVVSIPNVLTLDNLPIVCPAKQKEVLSVGRISYEKRIDLLLDIWASIEPEYPDWKLKIIGAPGKGEESLLQELRNKASYLGLHNVTFMGYQQPRDYYRNASIFCMTSSNEGFGLVLVEAMAFGTVPLAFDSYANAHEIINNGINGFLIKPFSIEEYTNHLRILMSDELLLKKFANNSMLKSKVYSKEVIVQQWIKLFKEIKK